MYRNILQTDAYIRTMYETIKYERHLIPQVKEPTAWFASTFSLRRVKSPANYNFYLIEVADVLQKYEDELRKPVRIDFHRKISDSSDNVKDTLAKKYYDTLSLLNKSYNSNEYVNKRPRAKLTCCTKNCFVVEENDFYMCCQYCGERFELESKVLSYEKTSSVQKNPHDKKHHFSECIDKFQGIQKCDLPQDLFEEMERRVDAYSLLVKTATGRAAQFSRVTKEHVKIVLKDMDLYKKYKEDINVIYKILTAKPLPQINHLKNRLLEDFCTFDDKYNQLFTKMEQSAYHYYLILYQLLYSYGVKCKNPTLTF